jgi:TRAP transporter TAXI family solute receptor
MKPPGNAPPLIFDMILRALGSSRDRIRDNGGTILQVAVSQISDMLSDDRADLYFETAVKGHPTLTEVSTLTPVRFLDLSPALQAKLAETGLKPSPFPAWFKGQQGQTQGADCGTVLIARDDLPDNLAYLVTRTICENREAMSRAHRAWADFDPSRAGRLENTGIPLHPGAERYYKERGWL